MHRILIIPRDLDLDFRDSFLSRASFEIQRVDTAAEGFAVAADWSPALVLFTSHLPDISAARFCAQARREVSLADAKLVMVTAQFGADVDLTSVDCDAHLIEPFEVSDLVHTIGGLLDVEVRRGPRISVLLLARVILATADQRQSLMANLLSLSDNGMLLECELPLKIGSVVAVEFYLPGTSKLLSLDAMVLFANELTLQYGMELVGVEPEQRAALRRFVATSLEEPG